MRREGATGHLRPSHEDQMTRELTYERYQSKRKKPGPTARHRAKRRRAEDPVKRNVRAECVERDGYCKLTSLSAWTGLCIGASEWMHLGDKKRARTRGMKPEFRHTTAGSMMGCDLHHDLYDEGEIALAMGPDGANGPMRAEYRGKVMVIR
jgi:hypothetical protein